MLLCDSEIQDYIESGAIGLDPFDFTRVQPTSVDLTLGNLVRLPNEQAWPRVDRMDMASLSPGHTVLVDISDGGLEVQPQGFLLATTHEEVALPTFLAARVEGKSSLGRIGLGIHVTAGFIDPGFRGQVTLEIYNFSPWRLRLHAGMPIGQICFMTCTPPARDYSVTGHYQGQQGPTESRYRIR